MSENKYRLVMAGLWGAAIGTLIGAAGAYIGLAARPAPPVAPLTAVAAQSTPSANLTDAAVIGEAAFVRVAAVQAISEFAAPQQNLPRLEAMIRAAAEHGAQIVVLPETAITGYMSVDLTQAWQLEGWPLTPGLRGMSPQDVAESVPGPTTDTMCALAGELGIYLTIPLLEVDAKTGRCFNTLALAGPDGRLLLHYRKLNPWAFAERGWADKGDRGLQYIDTPFGRLGLLICYDINFEPPRLAEAGVDILLYSIAWVDEADSNWFTQRLPEIARQNRLAIVGANWTVPTPQQWHGYAQSLILGRDGSTLASADGAAEQIIYADISVR